MNIKISLFMLISFIGCMNVQAQMKTVELNEVVIESLPFEKFTSGSKIRKSDSLQLALLGQGTLSDYMQHNSTVYIKEQGNKMLASVSFRGTGSSHTGVFWHGLSLNALTLGNSDFNSFPLFLFDGIAVQYGGASSLHGSDAIGGSIHLNSNPSWTEGVNIQVQQDIGSFGNVFSGVKADFGNGKWESKTRIFNRLLKNNFTYDIEDRLGDSYKVTQENANVHNYALLQEFNRKIKQNAYLSFKGWYGNNYHQIQPLTVTQPDEVQAEGEIFDQNIRVIAEYDRYFKNGVLNSSIGYVWDYQLYNDLDLIETNRVVANLGFEWNFGQRTTIKTGGNTKYIVPNVWSYDGDISEWRGDVFLSLNQEIMKSWQLNLNARKTFVPYTASPIAPSISTSYQINQSKYKMIFRGQLERSYRVPTFNDRYWPLQGIEDRPELKSEYGYSGEIGHNFLYRSGKISVENDIALYYMKIDDWIMWVPYGPIWVPENKKKVKGSGVELSSKLIIDLNQGNIEVGGMYAFNKSVLLEGAYENDPAIGYQLPYTPKHRVVLYTNFMYKKYRISIHSNYTGERNGIDVRSEKVDGFLLTDISLSRNFSMWNQLLSIEGKVINLFDIEYQNINRYAMPGRNYLLSINFFINN